MSAFSRLLTGDDFASFLHGTHPYLSQHFGAHHQADRGGTHFTVWAPQARAISVIGDFNSWDAQSSPLEHLDSGIWTGFVPNSWPGTRYKFNIVSKNGQPGPHKADPFAFANEPPPHNASIIWDLNYKWSDERWMRSRTRANSIQSPMAIYEVHLGSWKRAANNRWLSYSQLADHLIPYVLEMGWTHVEFLPVMEHPFYGSWGYQCTGYFAPTARYGTPQDFMQLIDRLHQAGIGVILDWVPSHFATDDFGLGQFDGTPEFEPADPQRATHPDWKSYLFDYGRGEVRSFLLSSALFWLDTYHVDCLRVDAVASMLYLDYSRGPGQWTPNRLGTNHHLEAISFLQAFTQTVAGKHSDVRTIAEESTAWPHVTGPQSEGGLGFDLKWDMGWMHDTLQYLGHDPIERKYHHGEATFRAQYAFSENFVLPLSHDEVVHGKGSLLRKMRGNDTQKLANLRLLFAYMYAQPGKKLLFMGSEFGSWSEWNHDASLNWDLLGSPQHAGVRLLVGQLNHLYRSQPALHVHEHSPESFQWIDQHDAEHNTLSFLRRATGGDSIAVVCNFSGVAQLNYRFGLPEAGEWLEILNTDGREYGGSGMGNYGCIHTVPISLPGFLQSGTLQIAPLSAIFLRLKR